MDGRTVLIQNAEISGEKMDLRIDAELISEIAPKLARRPEEPCHDAAGGALLPGLHDHHLHLFALAAALESVPCGPPEVTSQEALAASLRARTPDAQGWIRGTGYFESVAGPLHRSRLDAFRSDVPVRIQHRSGSMWFLNSAALRALGLDDPTSATRKQSSASASAELSPDQIERDASGQATGRLFRADAWLRERLPRRSPPDLAEVGTLLARFGVTAVTDATPNNGPEEWASFRQAQADGRLPQHLRLMGRLSLHGCEVPTPNEYPRIEVGEHKILLDEPLLPNLEQLIERIQAAHAQDRSVAIHTVTRTEIHFALAALERAGARAGDRLEHASVAPPEAMTAVAQLGLRIVTQPNFIAERGDDYLERVDPRDQPHLYGIACWQARGVPVGGGTDAPFGRPDPWRAMRAAVERCAPSGACLRPEECLDPESALRLFGANVTDATGAPGTREARTQDENSRSLPAPKGGERADLCLLDRPWRAARTALRKELVAGTWVAGRCVYRA